MPVEGGRDGFLEGPLFASVLALEGADDDARARLLRWVPLVAALHVLMLWGLSQAGRGSLPQAGSHAREDVDRVLRLLSGTRPPSNRAATPSPAHDAPPRPTPPRSAAAPKHRALSARRLSAPASSIEARAETTLVEPMNPASTAATPSAATAEASPEATADAPSPRGGITGAPGNADGPGVSGAELDKVALDAVRGVAGSILGSGNVGLFQAPSQELTDEQREEWLLRYTEQVIDARFEFVRYPHQAAAAGIRGLVVVKVSVGAKGQLLHHELLGRCPHYVLCDAAMELVKNASPFPPPPPELGRPVVMELPFNFHL